MTKLVCFDLDDTLTREIHSVMLLCILNGKLEQLLEIEKRESSGELHWIEADYHKAALIRGLLASRLREGFLDIMKPLSNIAQTVDSLKKRGIQSIVITAGPKQVAHIVQELWNFNASYGSDYEVVNGVFSGRILDHIGDRGKVSCLQEYCHLNGLFPHECIAVGDGSTDIPLFEFCATSIAINASDSTCRKATHSLSTYDLLDILQFV